jgi:Fic family protein
MLTLYRKISMPLLEWDPITDLPQSWNKLGSSELKSLAAVWKEQSQRLQESDALKRFNDRLSREWAIETGIIENLYTLDRGTTEVLIQNGIIQSLIPHGATNEPTEIVVSLIQAQQEALEGIFDFVKRATPLSTFYIRQLHQVITQYQEFVSGSDINGKRTEIRLIQGDWKKMPNNPSRPGGEIIHIYCPPEHVVAEMDRLTSMHLQHVDQGIPPEVEAAWLHHRFTQIHPFQDGNGRVARTLASLVLLREGWFPLSIDRDLRVQYLDALEVADEGDLQLLVSLITKTQKQAFIRALSISDDVLTDRDPLSKVIHAGLERLKARQETQLQAQQNIFNISENLQEQAASEFRNIAHSLTLELKQINQEYYAVSERSDDATDHWFKREIVYIAKELDYYADTRSHRAWVRMKIREDRQTSLIVAFHSLGTDFLGVLVASAFIEYRDRNENNELTVEGPHAICEDIFQFSQKEEEEAITPRFNKWIKDVLLFGLDQWRRQL